MTDQPRYSDDAVDEVIRAFRAGGRLDIDEDTIVLLTDAQRRRVYDALEREEFAAAGAWRTGVAGRRHGRAASVRGVRVG